MQKSIKCPAEDPFHYAGVNIQGIRKHIYLCKALKKKHEQTKIYQCQYCFVHHFLTKEEQNKHTEICGLAKQHIEWDERLNLVIIEPDKNIKEIEKKGPIKSWEYYRDIRKKQQEKKVQALELPQNDNQNSQESPVSSVSNIDSPKKEKKLKKEEKEDQSEPQQEVDKEMSPEELQRQEKMRIENEQKMRLEYLQSLNNKMKVDDYTDIINVEY